MIIPVKCFTCGMVLADKYRFYLDAVRKKKSARENSNIDKILYLTKYYHDKTPEAEVMDELGLTKQCCRRHFLTHVDVE